jgi:hypothetical protein
MVQISSWKGAGQFASALLLFFALPCTARSVAPECRSLSLSSVVEPSDAVLKDVNKALVDYETAFENEDGTIYHSLVHPSKHQTKSQSQSQFETLFPSYGLVKPKVTRSAFYELRFPAGVKDFEAECHSGKARGVVGPERQFLVQHIAFSKNEQIRITTLFAPIPKGVLSLNKAKYGVGIVMFHTQAWSHEHKTPVSLLEEARKWKVLKSPVVGWIFAEAARRILDSNPYFTPRELSEANSLVNELRPSLPNVAEVQKARGGDVTSWEYLGFTMVYQGYGIEPGFYFRMAEGEELNKNLEKCRRSVGRVFPFVKEIRQKFHGVECLPFAPGESLDGTPKGGTMFVPWSEVKLP